MSAKRWKRSLNPGSINPAQLNAEVHVWLASLNRPAEYVALLEKTLSCDERMRAERFHFDRDRRRFILGRGFLRAILGRYLACKPDQLQFRYGAYGKPYLSAEWQSCAIQFNLSHADELALFALTSKREIGIDVEIVQPVPQLEAIAARFFSKNEYASILSLPEKLRTERFYQFWTCKEAFIKALGNGLSHPLDQFEVSLVPGKANKLILDDCPQETGRWSLTTLKPSPGYLAALAVEGHDWQLRCGQWKGDDFLS